MITSPPYRFSGAPDILHLGFSVTHMMLQIAVVMGCNPIYLVGCDHHYNFKTAANKLGTAGLKGAKIWTSEDALHKTHFNPNYTHSQSPYQFITPKPEKVDAAMVAAREWCDANDVNVFNATPNTKLEAFPLVNYTTLFTGRA